MVSRQNDYKNSLGYIAHGSSQRNTIFSTQNSLELLILPIWYEITQQEVASYSPTLAGLVSLVAKDKSMDQMVVELAKVLRP